MYIVNIYTWYHCLWNNMESRSLSST